MTVKEIIEKLGRFPDDKKVEVDCYECGPLEIKDVVIEDDIVSIRDF